MLAKNIRSSLIIALLGATAFSSGASATNCSALPNTLTNGTTADAAQVMADFNALQNCANNNLASIASPSFTGNVGIGTTTPSRPLHITSTRNNTYATNSYAGIDDIYIYNGNASNHSTGILFGLTGNGGQPTAASIGAVASGSGYETNLVFMTRTSSAADSEKMRIDPNGNVGIGTTSPSRPLHITSTRNNTYGTNSYAGIDDIYIYNGNASNHSTGILFGLTGNGGQPTAASIGAVASGSGYETNLVFMTRTSSATDSEKMRIDPNGNVGIGTISPGYTLHVNGSVAGTSAYNNLSDARLKKNIHPIKDALNTVEKLQGVRFAWRTRQERAVGMSLSLPANAPQIGFIAQEVKAVLPEAVTVADGKEAIMSMQESKIVPLLVEAVKELKVSNDRLEREVAELRSEHQGIASTDGIFHRVALAVGWY